MSTTTPVERPDVSVIVLSRGDRNAALDAAVASALSQTDVTVEVVVVANGVTSTSLDLDGDPRIVIAESATNLGIPAGRNLGARHASAPVYAFLDDDARYVDDETLARCLGSFAEQPDVAAVALRIVDESGATAQRHIPRLGGRGADRSGEVTAFLGGASVVRADAFVEVGGLAGAFFFAMEETDLALRLVDAGWRIRYDAAPAVYHPRTEPSRHAESDATTMRNRVWLAHRNLPAPIGVAYVVTWLAITSLRSPRRAPVLARSIAGAWRQRPGPRRPIRWRTVARLTRLGRPPIV